MDQTTAPSVSPPPSPLSAKDFRTDIKPVWCPGCGDFTVVAALAKALAELELSRENTAVISGIGCSSRIAAYMSTYGFHGVHGRALPAATGLKLARPELTVLATGGDGDGFSIGGNHFLHACRRNVDITYIVMDNAVYGMTKGQASPTTDPGWTNSKLTPDGTGIAPVEPMPLAMASGANFIARGFSGNPPELTRLIVEGIRHPGFSFIQVLSPCVTFRPEQREWKQSVHAGPEEISVSDPREAWERILADDGMTTGILFAGNRTPFQPPPRVRMEIAEIEKNFTL